MNAVELLFASNVISRTDGVPRQHLEFALRVANLAYRKEVTVRWSGEDGVRHELPASYSARCGRDQELWVARARFEPGDESSLPGNVRFTFSVRMGDDEHAEGHGGDWLLLEADSGVRLGDEHGVALLGLPRKRNLAENEVDLRVAVGAALAPAQVFVRWTADLWKSHRDTPLAWSRREWDSSERSNARNPNQYGVVIHRGRVPFGGAARVDFAIGCGTAERTVWDDNRGANYTLRRGGLNVLTLNLHCYQEEDQDAKLSTIARAIRELDVDVVCLQEVAESWNDGRGDWESNAARILRERLEGGWFLHTDWSHLGFGRYREGVAILSRFPFATTQSRFVSDSTDPYDIHARRVVLARLVVPGLGAVNVFSAHLSWWKDGFRAQWDALVQWANRSHSAETAATLLCGDFNVEVGSEGYRHVVRSSDYQDQVLRVWNPAGYHAAFVAKQRGWGARLGDDRRIDHVFLKAGSGIAPVAARAVFTPQDYGRVSDHEGYLVTFEWA